MRSLLLAGAVVLLSGAASAQDCSDPQTQLDMNMCANGSFQKADKELNDKYQQILSRLADDADAAGLFRTAQRAWVPFRDAECAFVASTYEGGSMQPMVLSGCLEEMTRKRIADFDGYLTCGEGECPVPSE